MQVSEAWWNALQSQPFISRKYFFSLLTWFREEGKHCSLTEVQVKASCTSETKEASHGFINSFGLQDQPRGAEGRDARSDA